MYEGRQSLSGLFTTYNASKLIHRDRQTGFAIIKQESEN
jgi:hypothetical protein